MTKNILHMMILQGFTPCCIWVCSNVSKAQDWIWITWMLKQLGGWDCVSSAGKFQCFSPLYGNIKSLSLDRKSISRGTTALTVMKFLNYKPSNVFHAWVWLNGLRDNDLSFTHVDVLC